MTQSQYTSLRYGRTSILRAMDEVEPSGQEPIVCLLRQALDQADHLLLDHECDPEEIQVHLVPKLPPVRLQAR